MASELKSEALLEQMKEHLSTEAGKQLLSKIGLVYQFNIAPKKLGFDEVVYIVDLKKGEVKKGPLEEGNPDATFSFKDEDFVKIATGKMNPQFAFMSCIMSQNLRPRYVASNNILLNVEHRGTLIHILHCTLLP
ncbi:hypothetical protein Droror1_Dr00018134 [Drosera rotundifolia]